MTTTRTVSAGVPAWSPHLPSLFPQADPDPSWDPLPGTRPHPPQYTPDSSQIPLVSASRQTRALASPGARALPHPPPPPTSHSSCLSVRVQPANELLKVGPKTGLASGPASWAGRVWAVRLASTVWLAPASSWRPQKKKAERWSAVGRLADGGCPGRPGRAWLHRTAPVLRSRSRIWEGEDSTGELTWGRTGTWAPGRAGPGGAAPWG